MEELQDLYTRIISNSKALAASAAALAISIPLLWAVNDYREWIAFGTGGTPPTLKGYLKITNLRIKRFLTFDDLRDTSRLSSKGVSHLRTSLPDRIGARPRIISRTLPQRQHPESLDPVIRKRLHDMPRTYVSKYPDLLRLDLSVTEGRTTDAIYAKSGLKSRKNGAQDRMVGDEIAHVHPAENSMHVWLSEADCKKVVSAGWGERFPLSSLGMVNRGFVFLYAPRSMKEVDVIEGIVRAGIENVVGMALPE